MRTTRDFRRDIQRRHDDTAQLILDKPHWTDAHIARKVWGREQCAFWPRAQRNLDAGVLPTMRTHADIVRWAFEVASLRGWDAEPEHSLIISPRRRLVPDLVVRDFATDEVHYLVEVKTHLTNQSSVDKAVAQVVRYRDHLLALSEIDAIETAVLALSYPPAGRNVTSLQSGVHQWVPTDFVSVLPQVVAS